MTRDELKSVLMEEIGNIAPDVDPTTVREDAELQEVLDIDSISFLNLMIALKARLGVDVPEIDYPKVRTLRAAIEYLGVRLGGLAPSRR